MKHLFVTRLAAPNGMYNVCVIAINSCKGEQSWCYGVENVLGKRDSLRKR